ncbi:hypothetical protein GTO89_11115 [Heliobacterium gestii]|uniref:Uncharacterized protein n=1 Tax=Heliomicrobium gestii TaxID=2699 RepID=A0A845LDG8_HELGE|nr:hypothetical protein [Heliomicrobium gestii]MBM7866994.1 pimeloyl-ACP methyl ester carboxylesterase [Heliomicrobium gestii]MZP43591.1 hypothetical protein [Heliomicrobium gestii]
MVFVHGLGGDAFDTWRQDKNPETYWPNWVGQEFPEVGVWSLGYAASPTKWARVWSRFCGSFSKSTGDFGYAMSLPDRARQVLDLLVQYGLGKRPIMFICHSLGGLLVKQILRMSFDTAEASTERSIFDNTCAVLFLATPHQGADLATLLKSFRAAFPTLAIEDLQAHNAHLRDLFEWYRNHAMAGVQTRTYYEARRIGGFLIVNPTSAHPGVGASPVPLDEDHISIAKPLDRNAQVYVAARDLIRDHVLNPASVWIYRKDMEALKRQTRVTETDLSELTRLRIGEAEIKITRRCVQELRRQVEDQSMVVVGEPGAGKSGALHDLVSTLLQEGRDTVFLAVDRIDAESQSQLREQLGLEHDLDEVLENWSGDQPAFLVIDALDAARSERTAQMLSNLLARIVRTKSRWRVVASIRKFDLRHSRDLRIVFSGRPPLDDYKDPEFSGVCHVQVPTFSEEELSEVAARSAELRNLIESADSTLKHLLRVPFNLRLMGELLGEGVSIEELTPIRTQIELFDRYWEERVVQPRDGQRDAREEVLRRAASQMVENRMLRVSRAQVVTPGTSRALDQILSKHVLLEWQPTPTSRPDDSNLVFAHHVVFDFAVERLILRSGVDLTERLASDPELVLVIRPSLDMHFQHVWSLDDSRSLFWELVLRVMEDTRIPEVGKLIGPIIAATSSAKMSDLRTILDDLEDPSRTTSAEAALRHVIGGLLAMAPADIARRMIGQAAGPWADLVEYLSQRNSRNVAYIVCMLLIQLCERLTALTDEQQIQAGVAARNLLKFVWSQEPRNEWLVKNAITCVCQTYCSNLKASSSLLRFALRVEHLAKHGYQEVLLLAREARNIMNCDPAFVRDLYIAAFGYVERSEGVTLIGGSSILPLTSNRRQDYDIALYQLGEDFGSFIEQAPVEAVQALISIVEHHVLTGHTRQPENVHEETFLVDGVEAVIRKDDSSFWDGGFKHRHDEPLKMMDTFQTYFTTLGVDLSQTRLRQQLLNLLVRLNRMAALWRRVLICGAEAPALLGLEVRSLGWSLPLLKCPDTSNVAGDFLRAVYSYLSHEDREKIERAILSIPSTVDDDFLELGERVRDRLLGCLPTHLVFTAEAFQQISKLAATGGPPENVPPFRMGTFISREYSARDHLANQGVPIDDAANRRIQELEQPVMLFIRDYQNAQPPLDAVKDALPILCKLRDALSSAEADGVHPKQQNHSWGNLMEACACAAKCADLNCDEEPGAFLLSVLREASQHPEPRSRPEYDAEFDETPHWGKPAARIYAAAGLAELACFPSGANPELLAILEGFVGDPVPSVRYQVIVRLLNLHQTANAVMWGLIDRVVMKESNRGVLHGLLHVVLAPLASEHPDKIIELVRQIFDRTSPCKPLRVACVEIFGGLFLWQAHVGAGEMLQPIITNPLTHSVECHRFVAELRDTLTIGLVEPTKPERLSVRKRTWTVLLQVLQVAKEQWRLLVALAQEQGGWSEELQQQARDLAQIVNTASMDVYFSSGAYHNKQALEDTNAISLSPDSQRLFLAEAGEVLDVLADFSFARVTHHLLETLEYLVPVDPVRVFLRIGRTVFVGQEGGYQYDSMAADLVVRIVERYLAEYRGIFRNNPDCRRTLLELLDVFVKAGWPSAHRLTYRMDEIFR